MTRFSLMKQLSALLAVMGLSAMPVAQADTIINIKGYGTDGAGTRSNIAYPLAPGYTFASNGLINPVTLMLSAGDYLLSDAWGKPGALYDTWNFQKGAYGSWATHFIITEVVNNGYKVLFDLSYTDPACTNHYCAWSTEEAARDAFFNAAPVVLHLGTDSTLAFVSADYNLSDNLGGVSLYIASPSEASVPEPGSLGLILAGLGLVGLNTRRRNNPK